MATYYIKVEEPGTGRAYYYYASGNTVSEAALAALHFYHEEHGYAVDWQVVVLDKCADR